jgi:hypothetical protein
MKNSLPVALCFIHAVMRLRSVGRALGQLTVAYEAWVQADVFGLRASACIRRGKQLAHNGFGLREVNLFLSDGNKDNALSGFVKLIIKWKQKRWVEYPKNYTQTIQADLR